MIRAIKRIQYLIDFEKRTSLHDAAGVITPNGVESAMRLKAFEECLHILEESANIGGQTFSGDLTA